MKRFALKDQFVVNIVNSSRKNLNIMIIFKCVEVELKNVIFAINQLDYEV